ncbi:MAG: DoxX family membrane protein [Opitutaceae bacterium]|nr:DoxX family membrane protein [Opitutaceae bacterium]
MQTTAIPFTRLDLILTRWMARHGVQFLRLSMGLVFLWFGGLKFFPGLSPAEDLAGRTIAMMTFGFIPASVSLPLLAIWEVTIGIGFLAGRCLRVTVLLMAGQMLGTVTPLFFFPHETFNAFPFAPTLEGQYIIKNIVLLSAGLVLGAVVRGGRLVADPESAVPSRPADDRA